MPKGHKEGICQCGVCRAIRGELTGKNNPMYGKRGCWYGRKGYWAGKERPEHGKKVSGKGNFWYGKKRPDQSERMQGDSNPMKRSEVRKKLSETNSKLVTQKYIDGDFNFKGGHFFSQKNGRMLHYRSSYELIAYRILEQNEKVMKYEVESFHIDYRYGNSFHRYIPDILVTYKNGVKELIEVMSEWQFGEARKIAKLSRAHSYCVFNEMTFSVWTEKDLESKEGQNG